MDAVGAISEGEWGSLVSGMYTDEEADFMAQLLNNCPLPDELDGISASNLGFPSSFWPPQYHSTTNVTGASSYSSSDIVANTSSYIFSQGSSSYSAGSSILFPFSSSQESYYLSDSHPIFVANNNSPISMDFCMEDAANTTSYLVVADDYLNQEMGNGNVEQQAGKSHQKEPTLANKNLEPKRESEMQQSEPITENRTSNLSENSKKRIRSSGDVQKNRKNARSKKNQISVSTTNNNEDGNNAGVNGQSSDSCSSEDDSNVSQELNGGVSSSSKGQSSAINLNGKTRASRGAATDPQSLYARKRRERINEKLKILQNLVPNGTKVDISTMLEEAVQYVKFLQLQIKLLSSDDLWMYAPIAYNGMDIGLLDLKLGGTIPKRS